MSSILFLGSFVVMPLVLIWRLCGLMFFWRLIVTFITFCFYMIPGVTLGFLLSYASKGGTTAWRSWKWPGSAFLDYIYASETMLEIIASPYYLIYDIVYLVIDINIKIGNAWMWGPELFAFIIYIPIFINTWIGGYDA